MRFAELVSHRIFERKWRSREILRAHLFEGPFIRLNFGFVCELWHFVAYFGTKQTSQCWVDRLLLTYWNALWCVRVCGKSGYLKYRGSGWRGAVLVIAIRTVAITLYMFGVEVVCVRVGSMHHHMGVLEVLLKWH